MQPGVGVLMPWGALQQSVKTSSRGLGGAGSAHPGNQLSARARLSLAVEELVPAQSFLIASHSLAQPPTPQGDRQRCLRSQHKHYACSFLSLVPAALKCRLLLGDL